MMPRLLTAMLLVPVLVLTGSGCDDGQTTSDSGVDAGADGGQRDGALSDGGPLGDGDGDGDAPVGDGDGDGDRSDGVVTLAQCAQDCSSGSAGPPLNDCILKNGFRECVYTCAMDEDCAKPFYGGCTEAADDGTAYCGYAP